MVKRKPFVIKIVNTNTAINDIEVNVFKELQKRYNSIKISDIKVEAIHSEIQTASAPGDRNFKIGYHRSGVEISEARTHTTFTTTSTLFHVYANKNFRDSVNDDIIHMPMPELVYSVEDEIHFEFIEFETADFIRQIIIAGDFIYNE